MSLSCSCDYGDDPAWYYRPPKDYSILEASKRKRCGSCKELIDIGSTVALFRCSRPVRTEIEERIYGDAGYIEIADKFLCEECADLYFNLYELGFTCIAPDEDMRDLVKLYNRR